MITASHSDGPITPPATPLWNQSSAKFSSNIPIPMNSTTTSYPSPTTSSSRSSSSASLRPSFSTRSTSIRENVQVMVRCRPRSEKELEYDEEPCWLISPEEGLIEQARLKTPNSIRAFYYDVQGWYPRSCEIRHDGLQWHCICVWSDSQRKDLCTEKEPGVIPRAVQDVFSYIEEDTNGREYLLRVSYMEIYNEKIKDLLCVENTSPEIIEDKKGVYVRNLKEVIVKTSEEVMNCIREGEGNRHISATDYNVRSSRSHTIFQLVIESRSKGIPTSANRGVRLSQLNLIDLAGSEKVATDVERRKEGAYINKSLLTLGNVISKLTSNEPASHIPFRNSKLTRILQAALSGNARISVICTINPTFASKDESLNTLRFAQRAKLVKTAAKMTRILDNSELQNCLLQIAKLQTEMQEKNDLEAETRERLTNLLGLILTSSKDHGSNEGREGSDMYARLSNITSEDLKNDATMRDVVARCEEGIAAQVTAHNKQMAKMTNTLESMQDMIQVMEAASDKQQDALVKRDAHIAKLEQELAQAKASATMRPSKMPVSGPSTSTSSTTAKKPASGNLKKTMTPSAPNLDMLTPAIQLATQKITEAISNGLQLDTNSNLDDDDYDMLSASSSTDQLPSADISTAIHSIIRKALFSSSSSHTNNNNSDNTMSQHDIDCDTSAITHAIQNAFQNAAATEAAAPSTTSGDNHTTEFTPIQEAVSFVQSSISRSFVMESAVFIEEKEPVASNVEEADLPQLVQEEEDFSGDDAAFSETDATDVLTEDEEEGEFSSVEELVQHVLDKRELLPSNNKSKVPPPHYEPYTASIRQPSVLPILFNRWTLFAAIVFVLSQWS
ncbi:serine/threonine protein kinase [Mucor velutinosus]|uniref:Kinesin-like protein n=1 Tax=Mucor velutinosus TaxID=708070 RepID=A0AAN7D6U4_9FUNG|nr:serine/threonine protein kinase [Mucor velutinosus]